MRLRPLKLLVALFFLGGMYFLSSNIANATDISPTYTPLSIIDDGTNFTVSYLAPPGTYGYASYPFVWPNDVPYGFCATPGKGAFGGGSGGGWVAGNVVTITVPSSQVCPDSWIAIYDSYSTVIYHFIVTAGGNIEQYDYQTRFVSVTPSDGSTVGTTTSVGAEIYLSTNNISVNGSSTAPYNPLLEMDMTGIDNTCNISSFFPSATARIATSGDQIFTAPVAFGCDGLYSMVSTIRIPAFDQYPGETLTSTSTTFTVYNSVIAALRAAAASSTIAQPPVANCGITDLTGCVQNALVYLFWPNQTSINLFSRFKDLLYQKAPIGYFAQVQRALSSISSSSTPAIVGWSIPAGILSNFFTPLKTAIAGILWFFFLVHFYHRVKSLNLW